MLFDDKASILSLQSWGSKAGQGMHPTEYLHTQIHPHLPGEALEDSLPPGQPNNIHPACVLFDNYSHIEHPLQRQRGEWLFRELQVMWFAVQLFSARSSTDLKPYNFDEIKTNLSQKNAQELNSLHSVYFTALKNQFHWHII